MAGMTIVVGGSAPWGIRLMGGNEDPLTVARLRRNCKAQESGLTEGDKIVAINGQSCQGMSHASAMSLLEKSRDTLSLQVQRGGGQSASFSGSFSGAPSAGSAMAPVTLFTPPPQAMRRSMSPGYAAPLMNGGGVSAAPQSRFSPAPHGRSRSPARQRSPAYTPMFAAAPQGKPLSPAQPFSTSQNRGISPARHSAPQQVFQSSSAVPSLWTPKGAGALKVKAPGGINVQHNPDTSVTMTLGLGGVGKENISPQTSEVVQKGPTFTPFSKGPAFTVKKVTNVQAPIQTWQPSGSSEFTPKPPEPSPQPWKPSGPSAFQPTSPQPPAQTFSPSPSSAFRSPSPSGFQAPSGASAFHPSPAGSAFQPPPQRPPVQESIPQPNIWKPTQGASMSRKANHPPVRSITPERTDPHAPWPPSYPESSETPMVMDNPDFGNVDLARILSGNNSDDGSMDSALLEKKKIYADSAFYDDPDHKFPTIEEQIKMARRVAISLMAPANQKARGQNMFMQRREKSEKWVAGNPALQPSVPQAEEPYYQPDPWAHGVTATSYEFNANPHAFVPAWGTESPSAAAAKLWTAPSIPKQEEEKQGALSAEEFERMRLYEQKSLHNEISPQICFNLADDLRHNKGRGGQLFAKRREKSEKWVVDPVPSGQPSGPSTEVMRRIVSGATAGGEIPHPAAPMVEHHSPAPTPPHHTGGPQSTDASDGVPVNRLAGMVSRAPMTPWDAAAKNPYGKVDGAFTHIASKNEWKNPKPTSYSSSQPAWGSSSLSAAPPMQPNMLNMPRPSSSLSQNSNNGSAKARGWHGAASPMDTSGTEGGGTSGFRPIKFRAPIGSAPGGANLGVFSAMTSGVPMYQPTPTEAAGGSSGFSDM